MDWLKLLLYLAIFGLAFSLGWMLHIPAEVPEVPETTTTTSILPTTTVFSTVTSIPSTVTSTTTSVMPTCTTYKQKQECLNHDCMWVGSSATDKCKPKPTTTVRPSTTTTVRPPHTTTTSVKVACSTHSNNQAYCLKDKTCYWCGSCQVRCREK